MKTKSSGEPVHLLVAEDDRLLSRALQDFLESQGYRVHAVERCDQSIAILDAHTIHVALVDKKLPDGEGTSILEHIIARGMRTKMILMTAYGPDRRVREYIRKGTFDFMEKPVDLEKLRKRIQNAVRLYQLEYAREAAESYRRSENEIIGKSPAIQDIKRSVHLVAQSDSPVLIEGETGTGKELVARNIYFESQRRHQQFISVNCASIPENLFESEFFGYEKGAFTGAYQSKPGFFELANFGVLHLDEIGEMPVEFQAKLLRVLEAGTFRKLGGTREFQVDVRIIASTNKNLREEVRSNRFREDLFFRIAVFHIPLPPLRERREDIPLIAEHLWNQLITRMGKKKVRPGFSFQSLAGYPWQGNVRELRNHLEKQLIFSSFGESAPPPAEHDATGRSPVKIPPLETVIRDHVLQALKKLDYNKSRTARALGISLSTLKRKLRSWDIRVQKGLRDEPE